MKKLLFIFLVTIISNSFSQNGLHFDKAGDYVQTTYPGVLGNSATTVEAWIKPTSSGGEQIITSWGSDATNGGRFTFRVKQVGTTDVIRVEIKGGGIDGTIDVSDANWHHVAVTYAPTATTNKYKLYVDGVLDVQSDISTTLNVIANVNMRMGRRIHTTFTGYFGGTMDEVRIWNVTRSQADISANMNREFCSTPTSLKAYYKFNQGIAGGTNTTITSATDDAGTNNGALQTFALTGTTSNWVVGKNILPVIIDSTYTINACGTYTMPNGDIITTAGTYYDTISTSGPCDSLDEYNVSFPPAIISNTINGVGCVNYTTGLGKLITASGTYYDTISTGSGCDTTVQYNIVISAAVDDSVYRVGGRITSFDTWASHQWVRCDSNYKPIAGETSRFIVATQPGSYAVIVTRGSCVDTSDCVNINPAGINELSQDDITIYPNPTNNLFYIDFKNYGVKNIISIKNVLAQEVKTINNHNIKTPIDINELDNGTYFITIIRENKSFTKKIIKN